MALNEKELAEVAGELRNARQQEWPRLYKIRQSLHNELARFYIPNAASQEYRLLVEHARFNVLPVIVDAKAQNLFVDGYRPVGPNGRAMSDANAEIWHKVWQPNKMDARQNGIHRAAITYGTGYATVLPGDPAPVITPFSPLRMTCLYEDAVNDPWPQYAMSINSATEFLPDPATGDTVAAVVGATKYKPFKSRIYDKENVYETTIDEDGKPQKTTVKAHDLGVTPVIRYWPEYDADGFVFGKVEPVLPVQQQLHQMTLSLLITMNYQSFRQRWATGLALEKDEDGNVIEPFKASIDAMLTNESPDARFGDFAETDLSGYLKAREATILHIATTSQIPPHSLMVGGGISNISADTVAAVEAGHRLDIGEMQTSFGESHEQVLQLGAKAAKIEAAPSDSAEVVWRDTTPRSLAQIADALGKLATMLGIPVEALWERVPGATEQDLQRWKAMKDADSIARDIERMEAAEAAELDEPQETIEDGLGPDERTPAAASAGN